MLAFPTRLNRPLCIYTLILLLLVSACAGESSSVSPPPAGQTSAPPTAAIPTATAEPTAVPSLGIGSAWVSPIDGMVMVYVPAGPFLMGSEDAETFVGGHATDLRPLETVELDAFWIDRTEVTNMMYMFCVNEGACEPPNKPIFSTRSEPYFGNPAYANYPVHGVTWENANVYCQWAGRRLPNEAEWEKAARGTDGRLYPWGNEPPNCDRANYDACNRDTMAIGSLPAGASPYGVLDMSGNVWEWMSDWYEPEAYPTPFPLEGQEPVTETLHVVRGGCWANGEELLLVPMRFFGWSIDEISVGFGFRCARDATPYP